MSKNEMILKSVADMPIVIPVAMDKKALFNAVQDTAPVADLVGQKFKIEGIIPEYVDVPKTKDGNGDDIKYEEGEEIEMVNRLRLTIIANGKAYHSFSVTFNNALLKMFNVFGEEYKNMQFEIKSKTRGTGAGVKQYYVIQAV